MARYKYWSLAEDKFVQNNYNTLSAKRIGKILDRTPSSVCARANFLGLRKNTTTVPVKTKQVVVNNKDLQSIEVEVKGVKIHMVFK
jgi:hypothetical protein